MTNATSSGWFSSLRWESVALTDTGKTRKVNEDSFMSNDAQGHWAVADGMGGHAAGDVASQTITSALQMLQQLDDFSTFVDEIENALETVNEKLVELGTQKQSMIGSTVVGLTIHRHIGVVYWVGDSRLYRLRDAKLTQVTQDHTVVQEMLLQGLLTEEQVKTHPDKNVITRAIGSDNEIRVEMKLIDIVKNDTFLLCSDGVEKELTESEIEQHLIQHNSLSTAAEAIMSDVLFRGARDNTTLIAIRFMEE